VPRKTKPIEIHPERFKAAQSAYNEAQAAKSSGDLTRMAGALNKLGEILNEPKVNGRPLTEIPQVTFEELCRIQCTLNEIASVLKCSPDTVERWCKRTYQLTFADSYQRFSEEGKSSLRRAQIKSALGGNATMLIWMGKQILGQQDRMNIVISPEKADELIDSAVAAHGLAKPETFGGLPIQDE